jgi:NTP pyrophosphatase (non-canonical NTP hydrolase)
MDFKEYTKETQRTMAELGQSFADQLHMAMGISTEAGELLDVYKKALAYGKEVDMVNIREEAGDLMWYLSNLLRILGIDFEQTLQVNIDKLKTRYPDKFTEDKALNRDLDKEREILEELGFDGQG